MYIETMKYTKTPGKKTDTRGLTRLLFKLPNAKIGAPRFLSSVAANPRGA